MSYLVIGAIFVFRVFATGPACSNSTESCSVPTKSFEEVNVEDAFVKSILDSSDIVLFYAYDCPHCKEARVFLETLKNRFKIVEFEIKQNQKNLDIFKKACSCHNIIPNGIPVIFVKDRVLIGFNKGIKAKIKELLYKFGEKVSNSTLKTEIYIPMLGVRKLSSISLLPFSLYIGFLDGLNPCAMWVLVFLLGLLISTKDRKKIMIIGGSFVLASGLVYFAFMTAWFNVFLVLGYSKLITNILGVIAVVMGLINIKELFFFKKGVSLMIPEKAKPMLYKKLRAIVNTKSLFLSILGTFTLAVFVNFIELACTVGLPAVFTRIISLKHIDTLSKYWYMVVYNIAYVVPLAIIILLFIFFMERFIFTETHGKILKLISGVLMLVLGVVIIFFPSLLF